MSDTLPVRIVNALVTRGLNARVEAGSVLVEDTERTWCFSMADEETWVDPPIADLDPTTMAFLEIGEGELDDPEAIAAAMVKALGHRPPEAALPEGTRAIPPEIKLTRGAVMRRLP